MPLSDSHKLYRFIEDHIKNFSFNQKKNKQSDKIDKRSGKDRRKNDI